MPRALLPTGSPEQAIAEANDSSRNQVFAAMRDIVEKIVIYRRGPNEPVDIEPRGQPAALSKLKTPLEAGLYWLRGQDLNL